MTRNICNTVFVHSENPTGNTCMKYDFDTPLHFAVIFDFTFCMYSMTPKRITHAHTNTHTTLCFTHTHAPINQSGSIHRTLDPEFGTPSLPDPGFRRAEVSRHERLSQWFMDDDELDGLDTIDHSKVSSHAQKDQMAQRHTARLYFIISAPTYLEWWGRWLLYSTVWRMFE
jgi:hypothetical protein